MPPDLDPTPQLPLHGATLDEAMRANPILGNMSDTLRQAFRGALDHPVEVRAAKGEDPPLVTSAGAPPGPLPSAGQPALVLLGAHAIAEVRWTAWPYRVRGTLFFADTLFTDMANLTAAQMSHVGTYWVARQADLDALLAGPYGAEAREALAAMRRGFLLAASPVLDITLNADRMVFGAKMTTRSFSAGDVLVDHHDRRDTLYVVGTRGKVQVERRDRHGNDLMPFSLGFGGLFATTSPDHDVPYTQRVVAEEDGEVLVLASEPLRELLTGGRLSKEVARLLNAHAFVAFHADQVVSALAADPLFCGIDPSLLQNAIQGASQVSWPAGLPAPSPIGDLAGLSVVVDGEVCSYRLISPGDSVALTNFGPVFETLATYGPGRVFGQRTLALDMSVARHWQARVASHVVFVPRTRLDDTLGNDPAWADNLAAFHGMLRISAQLSAIKHGEARPRPAMILASRYDGAPWTRGLSALVLGALGVAHQQFDERSVLVELVRAHSASDPPVVRGSDQPVGWMRVPVSPRPADIGATLAGLVATLGSQGVSNLVIAVGPGLPDAQVLSPLVDRVAFFNVTGRHEPAPPEPLGAHVVFAWFLDDGADEDAPPYPPATTRLSIDLGRVEEWAASHPAPEVPADDRAWAAAGVGDAARQLGRIARTLTHRRVGLALSGGEAWGFAHYALIGAMEYLGIPVDMISGASSGAVLGAFYATGGMAGLRELLSMRGRLQAISAVSSFTSVPLEAYLDRKLDHARLERLLVPLVPVTTNLQMSSPEPVLTGSVAHACRLSGSFVPVYPPTPERRATYVDGAFSANLPADVLQTEGMRFVVASNAMSPASDQEPHPPALPGVVGRVLSDLNPIRRVASLYSGVLTLAYASGSASARSATRTFQAARTDASMFDIVDTPKIIHQAMCQPTLWQTMAGVQAHWELLCRPRLPVRT